MMNIHWRLGELYLIQQQRGLSESETEEFNICLRLNSEYGRKLSECYNLSMMAHMTHDWDWLHDICADIDKLELEYKLKKPTTQDH